MNASRLLGKCVICASSFRINNASSLPCGHTFHFRCILPWVQRSKTCPNCRAPTVEDQIVKQLFFDTSENGSRSSNEEPKGSVADDRESSPQSTGSDTSWHLNGEEAENDDALSVIQMLELAMGSDYLNSDDEDSISSFGSQSNSLPISTPVRSPGEWQSYRSGSIDSGGEEGTENSASVSSNDSSDHSLMSNDTSFASIATASSEISTTSAASYFKNESSIHSEDPEDRDMSPVSSDFNNSGEESSFDGWAWMQSSTRNVSSPSADSSASSNAHSEEDSRRKPSSSDSSPDTSDFSIMQTGAMEQSSSSSEGRTTGIGVVPRHQNPKRSVRGRNHPTGTVLLLTKARKRQAHVESDSDSSVQDCCRKRRTVE